MNLKEINSQEPPIPNRLNVVPPNILVLVKGVFF